MVEDTKRVRDISFEELGGKKVGDPVPVRTGEPISLEDLGGKRVFPYSAHHMAEPEELKDDEANSD